MEHRFLFSDGVFLLTHLIEEESMKMKSTRWCWIALTLLLLFVLVAAKGPANPWRGQWWSIDGDGSLQSVVFGGGGRFNYIDRGASVCGVDEDGPIYRADARGKGTVTGNSFEGTTEVRCLTGPPYIWGEWTFEYTYDAQTNTLLSGGTIYTRAKP